jgi:hypothetical protein
MAFPRKLRLQVALLLLAPIWACASAEPPAPPAPPAVPSVTPIEVAEARITAEAVQAHVSFLASDAMRGRDTPSPELEAAAQYLADRFGEMGLEPAGDEGSFIQRWPFQRLVAVPDQMEARFTGPDGEVRWAYGTGFFAVPGATQPAAGVPVYAPDPATAAAGLPPETRGNPLVVTLPDGFGPDLIQAIQAGMQAGASGIVLIMDEEADAGVIHQYAAAMEGGAAGLLPIPTIGIRLDLGEALLVAAGVEPGGGRDPPVRLDGIELTFRFGFRETSDDVPNVAAVLRGSDPGLRDTYVVVTAHFDHVGVGPADDRGDSIYSGADDNASGTSALLQVADAFAALPVRPARSVLFLAVSGEEKGLLGSAWFARNPTVPGEGIVANLNMDMVSRNHPDTVYAVGEEFTEIGPLAREVAAAHPWLGLVVAPDPEPEEQAFLRSDHFSFVQEGIPALMLTTWLHDDYHRPSDTPDRIDADKLARVARLAFLLAHRLAELEAPPEWTEEGLELLRGLTP